jgi:N-acetylglucosamine-6-sulfatase
VRGLPRLVPREKRQIDRLYRWRLQSMLAVDEMVEQVVDALRDAGRLDETYIFFSSDNGFFLGEHRLPRGKGAAYEEAIRVPLVVRGPGIPAGRRVDHITLNIDLAPTFAEIAGLPVYPSVDGRSLLPLFAARPPARAEWRDDALIEYWSLDAEGIPGFSALRTAHRLYVEYQTGDHELYDLDRDPYQLQNVFGVTPAAEVKPLAERLGVLRTCAGSGCR